MGETLVWVQSLWQGVSTLHGRMDFWRMAANYIYLLPAIWLGHTFFVHSEHRSLTFSRKWTCAKPSPSSAGMSRLDVLNFACSELDCFAGQDQLFWLVFAAWRHHHIIHASSNPLLPDIFRAVSAQFWRMQQDRNQLVQSFQSTRFLGNAERDGAAESCKLVWFAQRLTKFGSLISRAITTMVLGDITNTYRIRHLAWCSR